MLKKKTSNWAKQPRLKLATEKIQLVRKERGSRARGDVLLQSAQKAMRLNDVNSAQKDLENFLYLTQHVEPEHKSMIETEIDHLSRFWYRRIRSPDVINALILFTEILLWLFNRRPLSYKKRKLFPITINVY